MRRRRRWRRPRPEAEAAGAGGGLSPGRWEAHDRVVRAHLDLGEAGVVVHGPAAAVVEAGRHVEPRRVGLDGRGAAGRGIADDPVQQQAGQAVAPVGRGDGEARDAHGRLVDRIAPAEQRVVGPPGGVDPAGGPAVDVGEVAEGGAPPQQVEHLLAALAPVARLGQGLARNQLVGLQAVAARVLGRADHGVVVEEGEPVVDAILADRVHLDLADLLEPIAPAGHAGLALVEVAHRHVAVGVVRVGRPDVGQAGLAVGRQVLTLDGGSAVDARARDHRRRLCVRRWPTRRSR